MVPTSVPFLLLILGLTAPAALAQEACEEEDCLADEMSVNLLHKKMRLHRELDLEGEGQDAVHEKRASADAASAQDAAQTPVPAPVDPVTAPSGSAESAADHAPALVPSKPPASLMAFKKLWDSLNATQRAVLVPKDLAPLSLEEVRKLNASSDKEPALMDASAEFTPVYSSGVYCGSSTRFDVAGLMGTSLSIDLCYVFSCVAPFVASATCGPYFYANGQGNCKCCGYGSSLYYSTSNPKNYLYSCR